MNTLEQLQKLSIVKTSRGTEERLLAQRARELAEQRSKETPEQTAKRLADWDSFINSFTNQSKA